MILASAEFRPLKIRRFIFICSPDSGKPFEAAVCLKSKTGARNVFAPNIRIFVSVARYFNWNVEGTRGVRRADIEVRGFGGLHLGSVCRLAFYSYSLDATVR